jgi:hypothetical protein
MFDDALEDDTPIIKVGGHHADWNLAEPSSPLVPSVAQERCFKESSWEAEENLEIDQAVTVPSSNVLARRSRLWCHLYLNPVMLEPGFDLVKKIIGKEGCNTRSIFDCTRTKVRVRGRGSGHKERRSAEEANVHLMVALAAERGNSDDFRRAFQKAVTLIANVSEKFRRRKRQQDLPDGAKDRLFWVSELSDAAKSCLGDLLDGLF